MLYIDLKRLNENIRGNILTTKRKSIANIQDSNFTL